MTPPDLFLTILSSQKDGLFFATESCIVGPSSRPRQWKSSCLSPLGGCRPAFLLLYLPHSTLWNLSFFPGCYCLLRSSFWVGTTCKGLWSPGPQPEWQVTFCPRTKTAMVSSSLQCGQQGTGAGYVQGFWTGTPQVGSSSG